MRICEVKHSWSYKRCLSLHAGKRGVLCPASGKTGTPACVHIKASGSNCHLPPLYSFSEQLLLSCLSFSCQVCSLTVAPLVKWRPVCLAPGSHLTAAQSASHRCPPHNNLFPAPKWVTAVRLTTIALGMHICCMTVTHPTPWSLKFKVQVTWKCWRRQIYYVQHFNGSPCTTKPQNSSSNCVSYQRQILLRTKHREEKEKWLTERLKANLKTNRVWFFTQGVVKLRKCLMKNIGESIHLSGGKPNKFLKKNLCLFHPCCILERKNSLGGDALNSLRLLTFEILLWYGQKRMNKLSTRLIFIFTSPKPLSASQWCCILTSTFRENLFARRCSVNDLFQFTSSLQTF